MQKSALHDYQKLSTFDLIERQFLMQERHDRTLTESVMHALSQIPDLMSHLKSA